MVKVFDWIAERPRMAALFSALALLDMSNCIRLGHSDWFIPAFVAFSLAYMVK